MDKSSLDKLTEGLPKPEPDTLDLFVELDQEDLHFLDDIVKSYDGIANVRREYRPYKGQKQFKILVSPDFLVELKAVLRNLRQYIYIGEITVEGPSNGC
ncbi:MAG: DUF4911 domain-containing protein [Candidatus Acetothermia bacterium]